jgi:hypothetical protein
MTLVQLLSRPQRSVQVPAVRIHDWPAQQWRGISDDLSRGQVSTLDDFKRLIRFLARYKLNVYSPYIEDIFRFSRHPLIGRGRGALDPAEVRELDQYARRYHIEMVPIFETLGHWENILTIPEYVQYAEFPGAHTVNVTDERVYDLLDEMIGELAAVFHSPYFNMAADESWDVGRGASRERVAASDLATVHAEHYNRVIAILARHGKRPLMYGDIILNHPAILEKIPNDVTIVDWQYWAGLRYPSTEVFHKAGFPFLVSPAVWNFTGPYPNYLNTFINVRNFNEEGRRQGALGLLTSTWNDYGGEALRELNLLGYAWTAECAWHPEPPDAADFGPRFYADFLGSPLASQPAWTATLLLASPYNQYLWHELWRHPMLPPRESALHPLWRMESIRSSMPLVKNLLQHLRSQVTRNAAHLDHLDFVAELNLWFAAKLEAIAAVRRLAADSSLDASARSAAAEKLVLPLISGLEKLRETFRGLWLRTNRPDNLDLLLERYNRQASYWRETLEALARGDTNLDPTIRSRWIYHPDAHPGMRDTAALQVKGAIFQRTLSLPARPVDARVQLMGDTQAKLKINEDDVGEVFARRSLSLTVERERIKVFDLTARLREGTNTLTVEAHNYEENGSAGCNVYALIALANGDTVTVLSDSTWLVREIGDLLPGDSQEAPSLWRPAGEFPYPAPVIEPNFSTRRYSWIER